MKTASIAAASTAAGFNIHEEKRKILEYNTENTSPITLDGKSLEEVGTFTHLDSIIDERRVSDVDVKGRIDKIKEVFRHLNNIWNSKQLSVNIKVRIFNTNVKPVLLYGAET